MQPSSLHYFPLTWPFLLLLGALLVVVVALIQLRVLTYAYIAGSLGTLIGADLLNLGKLQGLGAPLASIGVAGTFDGVFLTGIIAVLLPPFGLASRPEEERSGGE